MPVLPDSSALGTQNPRAARGQPSYRASPVGGALQGFGQALGALGGTLSAEQERQKAEVDKTLAFGVQDRLNQFDANWTKQLNDRTANVTPGAAGLSEKFNTDFTQSAREFMGTVPVPLQQQVDIKLGVIKDSFTPHLQDAQRKEAFRYGQEKITDGLNTLLTRLSRTPDKWPEIQKEGEAFIRSNPAYSPVQQDEAIRAWTEDRRIANIKLDAELNGPTAVKDKLGVTPGGAGDIDSRIIQIESSGDPNTPNKAGTSRALGLGQFIPSTWRQFIIERHPDLLAQGEDIQKLRTDPTLSREAVGWYRQQNTAALQAAGLPITPGNIYLSHFLGPGGAKNLLSADPNASAASVLDPSQVTANKSVLAGKTVGEVIAWASNRMGEAGAPPDPDYAGLDYNKRVAIYDQLVAQDRKDFSNQVADTSAFLRSGGPMPQGYDLSTLQQRLGPQEGQQTFTQLQQDAAFGSAMSEIRMAPPERVAAIVSQAQDALSSPTDFADNAAIYKGITEAVDARRKDVAADPAGYVIKNDPQVAQAWQSVEPGGQGYTRALQQTSAAQMSIGVPLDQIAPLPKEIAARGVSLFKNVDLPDEQRVASLSPIIFGSTDPSHPTTTRDQQQAVFQQLVRAGLPDIAEGAVEAAARGDTGAAQRLFEAVMVDPAKIGKTPKNAEQINAQIQSDIMDSGMIGDVAYGLTLGDATNYERAIRDTELMQRSVQLRMVNGVTDLADAVKAVKKDLFGDRDPIKIETPAHASLLLPQGTDATTLGPGLAAAIPQFRTALEATGGQLTTENIPASDGSRAIVQAAKTNSISRVIDTGIFRNIGDGVGLFDPYTSLFVVGENGRPLVIPLDAILRLGVIAPTADAIERSGVKKQLESMTPPVDGGY